MYTIYIYIPVLPVTYFPGALRLGGCHLAVAALRSQLRESPGRGLRCVDPSELGSPIILIKLNSNSFLLLLVRHLLLEAMHLLLVASCS